MLEYLIAYTIAGALLRASEAASGAASFSDAPEGWQ